MSLARPKISQSQVIILLLISRMSVVLNYVPIFSEKIGLTAALIGNLIALPIGILMLIPACILQKKHNSQHIIDIAITKNKTAGIVIGIAFYLIILFNIMGTIVGFEFFMTNAIYPNSSIMFIVMSIIVVCFLCAGNGLEGIARTGTLVFIITLAGILFIVVVASKSVDLLNIKPIMDNVAMDIAGEVLYSISKYYELLLMLLLLPNIKGTFKKCGIIYLIISTIFVEVVTFYIASVLGEYAYSQIYPYYTLASIIETNLLQRLDSIHMMIWVFITIMRIVIQLIVAANCLQTIFVKMSKRIALLITFLIISPASIYLSFHPELIKYNSMLGVVLTVAMVVVVPLLLLGKRKGGTHEDIIGKEALDSDTAIV